MSAPARLGKFIAIIAIVVSVTALGVLTITLRGKPFSENTQAIAEASASVVTIYTYDINNVNLGSGSGFAAIEEGIIVTNYHVIGGETYRIEAVTESGVVMDADSVIAHDPDKDIAILRFYDCSLPLLPTDPGLEIERGETLTAIGSPKGFNNMVSTGVFSSYKAQGTNLILLFTTSISHGSSGGALFNEDGKVVAITSGGYEDANDIYIGIPFYDVTVLYNDRNPADEITPAKLWEQTEHTYTIDYVLAYPRQLSGKTIELKGYTSAVYHDLYLTASPANILHTKPTKELTDKERSDLSDRIYEQRKNGSILMCQRESRSSFDNDLLGKHVTLRGKVMLYSENTSGNDVRFIVSEVIAKE
ncbi:MAG: trypsin-like peptidase domain-containing protein [Oscillospiraceae bacterium]|nr:trypsin-like peptidase domain-containing protein [Oscillospiraceae bacterium]